MRTESNLQHGIYIRFLLLRLAATMSGHYGTLNAVEKPLWWQYNEADLANAPVTIAKSGSANDASFSCQTNICKIEGN